MTGNKRNFYLILVFSTLVIIRFYFLPGVSLPSRLIPEGGFFLEARTYFAAVINQLYPPLQADLVKGLLLGINDFPYSFKQNLITTGTIHVVVVSGYNVALVAGAVLATASLWGRKSALVLSLMTIILYTLLTGAQAPTVRAAIMGSLVFGAQGLGRQKEGLDLLIIASGIMLLVDPSLIGSVSFQLSVLATLGIIVIGPRLKKVILAPKIIKEDLVSTLAAQALVVPVIFFHFGQVSWISPLVNVLVLWTVPVGTILGFISLFLGLVFMPLAQLVAWVNYLFLGVFTGVVSLFKFFPVVEVPAGNWPLLIGFYMFVIGLIQYKRKENKRVAPEEGLPTARNKESTGGRETGDRTRAG